jgi:hypothetical protein
VRQRAFINTPSLEITMTEAATTTPVSTSKPADADDTWTATFDQLKIRFPTVKDTILFAFDVMQSDPDIALDDLKARANLHGLRVTAATVSAAERLLSRQGGDPGGTVRDRYFILSRGILEPHEALRCNDGVHPWCHAHVPLERA